MKRHPALRDLSVDHHHALVQAHRLQHAVEAGKATQRVIGQEFFHFWKERANIHFREEDEALLPFFARFGDVNAEPIRQRQREHILIRRDVALLQAQSTLKAEAMRALGAQFEAHVRLEEREVFPLIEAALSEDALTELAALLKAWQGELQSTLSQSTLSAEKV